MPKPKYFITIGTFDGVHIGHRMLFNRLEQLAVQHQLKPLVLYFPYPPKTLLSQTPAMTVLSAPPEKEALLKSCMPKSALEKLNFQIYREYSPEQFFKKVLLEKYQCGGILAGPDFAFGKNRKGDVKFLQQKCAQYNIPFELFPFYDAAGMKISSSAIRKQLAAGDIFTATKLLGTPYSAQGRVIAGKRLGRKLGFPTANLDINFYKLLPLGVYAVKVRLGKKWYRGVCNIGYRPTVNPIDSIVPLTEVHILDFHQSIYGRRLQIYFVDKIRSEVKFDSLPLLQAQLAHDKQMACKLIRGV